MQNKGYPADWLYQLKQKNNIVSVLGKYIHLDKKGGRYWACCPFHNEKTPSFCVSEDEGFFYCFGCKETGDAITFVQKYESCDFSEAVAILAKSVGMEVPQFNADPQTNEKKETKERVLKLLDCAYKHYQENLYLPQAKPAQEYIKTRGFTKRELDDFKLGYSLGWTEMIEYLRRQGFTYKEMLDAGVAKASEGGEGQKERYYDVMAGRLMFPIFNAMNECVGFSARALEKTDFAKYLNTAETVVFQKGRVVFGINLVKPLKYNPGIDRVIICEGQIDVIAMHRAGFKTTVACMGTALTKENAKELKKLSHNVTLCFDGDTAGIKATVKSIDILKEEGFHVSVVSMPEGRDPDEILRMQGKEALQKLIDGALTPTDFLINTELKNFDLSKAEEKGKFATTVLGHISKIGASSEEEPYLDRVRKLTQIPIDILRRDLDKIKYGVSSIKKQDANTEQNVIISRENGNIRAIKFILGSLIFKKNFVLKSIDYKKLLPRYADIIEKASEGLPVSSYYDYFDVESMPMLKDCLAIDFGEFTNSERYFEECVWLIASDELKAKQKELTEKFKLCEDQAERMKIMQELSVVNKAIREKKMEEFYVR